MDYVTFKNRHSGLPIILGSSVRDNDKTRSSVQVMRNQMTRWQNRGLVVKLKNGMYLLNEHDRKINPSRLYLANQMYVPSYVSLEYALAYYGLIPERVVQVTSVTTKKTFQISNPTGQYVYRRLTVPAFKGFRLIKDENGLNVFLAEPEKAVLDFLYFNMARVMKGNLPPVDIFEESYRFQDVGILSEKRLLKLALLYNNGRLMAVARLFCRFRKEAVRS